MYKPRKYGTSTLKSVDKFNGEPIEWRVDRMINNNEPITDEVSVIYTDKAEGVGAEFNIRTDRFELAAEGMDLIQKQKVAKSEAKAQKVREEKEAKVIELKPKEDSGAESINGTSDSK